MKNQQVRVKIKLNKMSAIRKRETSEQPNRHSRKHGMGEKDSRSTN